MTIEYLQKLHLLGQIAEQQLRLLEQESSCSCMSCGTYGDRKRAILSEYSHQVSELEKEYKAKQQKGNPSVAFNQSADQIFNMGAIERIEDLDKLDKPDNNNWLGRIGV